MQSAYLVHLGVTPVKMITISYGEKMALIPGHDEGAWVKNRKGYVLKR